MQFLEFILQICSESVSTGNVFTTGPVTLTVCAVFIDVVLFYSIFIADY